MVVTRGTKGDWPPTIWSARLTCCSRRAAYSSHEYRDLWKQCVAESIRANSRSRMDEGRETKQNTRRRDARSAILGEQNLSENSTIDIRLCSTWNNRRKCPSEFANATARGLWCTSWRNRRLELSKQETEREPLDKHCPLIPFGYVFHRRDLRSRISFHRAAFRNRFKLFYLFSFALIIVKLADDDIIVSITNKYKRCKCEMSNQRIRNFIHYIYVFFGKRKLFFYL